jgi:hypothetical protein
VSICDHKTIFGHNETRAIRHHSKNDQKICIYRLDHRSKIHRLNLLNLLSRISMYTTPWLQDLTTSAMKLLALRRLPGASAGTGVAASTLGRTPSPQGAQANPRPTPATNRPPATPKRSGDFGGAAVDVQRGRCCCWWCGGGADRTRSWLPTTRARPLLNGASLDSSITTGNYVMGGAPY